MSLGADTATIRSFNKVKKKKKKRKESKREGKVGQYEIKKGRNIKEKERMASNR